MTTKEIDKDLAKEIAELDHLSINYFDRIDAIKCLYISHKVTYGYHTHLDYTLEDLKLPEDAKISIFDFCKLVKSTNKVNYMVNTTLDLEYETSRRNFIISTPFTEEHLCGEVYNSHTTNPERVLLKYTYLPKGIHLNLGKHYKDSTCKKSESSHIKLSLVNLAHVEDLTVTANHVEVRIKDILNTITFKDCYTVVLPRVTQFKGMVIQCSELIARNLVSMIDSDVSCYKSAFPRLETVTNSSIYTEKLFCPLREVTNSCIIAMYRMQFNTRATAVINSQIGVAYLRMPKYSITLIDSNIHVQEISSSKEFGYPLANPAIRTACDYEMVFLGNQACVMWSSMLIKVTNYTYKEGSGTLTIVGPSAGEMHFKYWYENGKRKAEEITAEEC